METPEVETLLCRRVELARAGEAHGLEAVLELHLRTCEPCREDMAMEDAVAASLRRHSPRLSSPARRRIEQLIAVRSSSHRSPGSSLFVAAVAGAAAALVAVALLLPAPPRMPAAPRAVASLAPVRLASPPPVRPARDPVTGLQHLMDRHLLPVLAADDVPLANVVYEARMPLALANQLISQPESQTPSWDGLPGMPEVHNATLFVLERQEGLLDPVISDVLDDFGSLTLFHGPHQIAMAARDDRVFLIIADPAGVEALAGSMAGSM